ncbi:D-TA family PLP-dependent enzyme [Oscillospiraceae bacterium PP1C4]
MEHQYTIANADQLITPALVYYKEIITANTEKAIRLAGGAQRLWPHVKSHKMSEMVKLQMQLGISRFKCATIAEAEMLADCGAPNILLAYPLVGPNIQRFLTLEKSYPALRFWAIGDDYAQLKQLAEMSDAAGIETHVLIDMNLGMNRTGVPMDQAERLYASCALLKGIKLCGFHCYDGNHNDPNIELRLQSVAKAAQTIAGIKKSLSYKNIVCPIFVMGGTPSFPCHAQYPDVYLSPGTAFITDHGYFSGLRDLNFVPGAAVLTRVISHPAEGLFTLDLGYKGIASDPAGARGVIIGMENAQPLFQSEEHWVFRMREDCGEAIPEIGTLLYVIPTHICPTSALYPSVQVVENGQIVDCWEVTARNRKLTI